MSERNLQAPESIQSEAYNSTIYNNPNNPASLKEHKSNMSDFSKYSKDTAQQTVNDVFDRGAGITLTDAKKAQSPKGDGPSSVEKPNDAYDRKPETDRHARDGADSMAANIAQQVKNMSMYETATGRQCLEFKMADGSKSSYYFKDLAAAQKGNYERQISTNKEGKIILDKETGGNSKEYKYDDNGKLVRRIEKTSDGTVIKDQTGDQIHQEKLERLSEMVTRGIKKETSGSGVHARFMNHYSALQSMYNEAKQMSGDPKATVEAQLNEALAGTGHQVKIQDSMSKDAPRIPWQRSVEATMTVDPKGNKSNDWGRGIIGLGAVDKLRHRFID